MKIVKVLFLLAIVISISISVSAEEFQIFVAKKDISLVEVVSEFCQASTEFFFGYSYDSVGDFYGWNQKSENINGKTVYGWRDGITVSEEDERGVIIKKGTVIKVPKKWKKLDIL